MAFIYKSASHDCVTLESHLPVSDENTNVSIREVWNCN